MPVPVIFAVVLVWALGVLAGVLLSAFWALFAGEDDVPPGWLD